MTLSSPVGGTPALGTTPALSATAGLVGSPGLAGNAGIQPQFNFDALNNALYSPADVLLSSVD